MSNRCIIIGASHAGVNCAFSLRKEGWGGDILVFDSDPELPYHRPPLSKAFLTEEVGMEKLYLKPRESYEKENIRLYLGNYVEEIDPITKSIKSDGESYSYKKLVIATGARPIIPPIPGLESAANCFPLRSIEDVMDIRKAMSDLTNSKVIIIGGGYIGLEAAASLKKIGADKVTILERESRILSRVTSPEMSTFFEQLHIQNNVEIRTSKEVIQVNCSDGRNTVICADNSRFEANILILGAGIHVNTRLAEMAGLEIENGIRVDPSCKTNDPDIYAIGDCTFHHSIKYDRHLRLESVQNAVDQAKVAASSICGNELVYNQIPWFWSDQYDIKLQIAGLSDGYNHTITRMEEDHKFSIWYFQDDLLLAVDAVNQPKAYMIGKKFLSENTKVNKEKLGDPIEEFKPTNLIQF